MSNSSRWSGCLCALVVACASAASAQTDLVFNGGFETGNFSGWSVPPIVLPPQPNPSFFEVYSGGGSHTGTYHARLSSTQLQYMTQILPTTSGTDYELSFWLRQISIAPEALLVRWEGATVFNQLLSNPDPLEWRHFTLPLHANITGSFLEFGQSYFPLEFHIDDISVVQVPAPGAGALLGMAGVVAMRRRRR